MGILGVPGRARALRGDCYLRAGNRCQQYRSVRTIARSRYRYDLRRRGFDQREHDRGFDANHGFDVAPGQLWWIEPGREPRVYRFVEQYRAVQTVYGSAKKVNQ